MGGWRQYRTVPKNLHEAPRCGAACNLRVNEQNTKMWLKLENRCQLDTILQLVNTTFRVWIALHTIFTEYDIEGHIRNKQENIARLWIIPLGPHHKIKINAQEDQARYLYCFIDYFTRPVLRYRCKTWSLAQAFEKLLKPRVKKKIGKIRGDDRLRFKDDRKLWDIYNPS